MFYVLSFVIFSFVFVFCNARSMIISDAMFVQYLCNLIGYCLCRFQTKGHLDITNGQPRETTQHLLDPI